MPRRLKLKAVLVGLQLLAFWPVWRWYVFRVFASFDEVNGIGALFTAILFLLTHKPRGNREVSLIVPAVLTLIYTALYPFLPPLLRASLAFVAVGSLWCTYAYGTSLQPGILGLLLLSLPILPTAEFYMGYPLRRVVALLTAPLLRVTGFEVVPDGTCLNWSGELVWIDGPCSGIKMLWAGAYLSLSLASWLGLSWRGTSFAVALSAIAVVIGNILRSASLFYMETGIVHLPAWAHEWVGIAAFLLAGVCVAHITLWKSLEPPCVTRPST